MGDSLHFVSEGGAHLVLARKGDNINVYRAKKLLTSRGESSNCDMMVENLIWGLAGGRTKLTPVEFSQAFSHEVMAPLLGNNRVIPSTLVKISREEVRQAVQAAEGLRNPDFASMPVDIHEIVEVSWYAPIR